MTKLCIAFLLLLTVIAGLPTAAQEADPRATTAYRETSLHAGPGITHTQTGWLQPGVPITIIERNHTGNWLHVQNSERGIDAWVRTGYLNMPPQLRFSEVPINADIADANPANVENESLSMLYAYPVISPLSPAMVRLYAIGQMRGNDRRSVTKVGDSLSASRLYLQPMSRDDNELGPYDYLTETLAHFGPAAGQPSVAAVIGLSSIVVFDPTWADSDRCTANESPLMCEYRLKRPSVAFIAFGPNDVRSMNTQRYTDQMTRLVEETLALHIIPVLATFSCDPDAELWWQCIEFNLALAQLATAYDVPLINFWAAATELPDYGLDIDRVHLAQTGFQFLRYSSGHESWYGASLQNLLALRMLDEIRRTTRMQT